MKQIYFTFILFLLLAVSLPAQAEEPTGTESVNTFTFTPSTSYEDNTVSFTIEFTVEDVSAANSICLYYDDGSYQSAIDGIGNLSSDNFGDTYSQTTGSAGNSAGACPGVSGYYASEWRVNDPHDFADGGDSLTASFTVPGGAATETFIVRQRNPGQINTLNATLTINDRPSEAYVSNTPDCSGNAPCFTGGSALDDAIDTVAAGGTVYIVGTYSQSGNVTATLNHSKNVTISGFNNPVLDNGGAVCSGPMIEHQGLGVTLMILNVTIDGSCAGGLRSGGVLNSSESGLAWLINVTIRDFSGAGNAGVEMDHPDGRMIVEGSTFENNYKAMESNSGELFAFANNVLTNSGNYAATGIDSDDNVTCNYWGSAPIDNSLQYAERLGSPVVTYAAGVGPLILGNASLAPNGGLQVLINLGRNTVNPPFNNGTAEGLGALASDFFAACGTNIFLNAGPITITADAMTPGSDGFRLYSIEDPSQCSPSDHTGCWDFQNVACANASCSLTDPATNDGMFVVGNQMDPTAILLASMSTASTPGANVSMPVAILIAALLLFLGSAVGLMARRHM